MRMGFSAISTSWNESGRSSRFFAKHVQNELREFIGQFGIHGLRRNRLFVEMFPEKILAAYRRETAAGPSSVHTRVAA